MRVVSQSSPVNSGAGKAIAVRLSRGALTGLVVALGLMLAAPSFASAADSTTITCFGSGTKEIAGLQVTLVDAGAPQGTHLPCGYWFSPDYFEHYHPRRSGTVASAWTFSPGLNSVIIRMLYNADGGNEEYTLIAKDSGGNQVGDPIVYFNKDEAGRRIDFPKTVTRLEAWHKAPGGALALFNFSVPSNRLGVNVDGEGNVKSDVGGIDCGGTDAADCTADFADIDPSMVVTLTATPDSGKIFTGWTGACTGSSSTCTVTMSEARNVTATFSGISYGYLAVDVEGEGKVESSPAGIDFGLGGIGGTDREGQFVDPTPVTLTATPQVGWKFLRWEGDRCSGSSPTCVITVDNCLETKAVFERIAIETIKVSGASTKSTQRKGTKSLPLAFKSSLAGHARVALYRCAGSNCAARRLHDELVLATQGPNAITVATSALAPGRYRFVVSTAHSSAQTHFTVAAPKPKPAPKPRFTG